MVCSIAGSVARLDENRGYGGMPAGNGSKPLFKRVCTNVTDGVLLPNRIQRLRFFCLVNRINDSMTASVRNTKVVAVPQDGTSEWRRDVVRDRRKLVLTR